MKEPLAPSCRPDLADAFQDAHLGALRKRLPLTALWRVVLVSWTEGLPFYAVPADMR